MLRSILMICVFLLGGYAAQAALDPGYKVGDKAADFKLKNVDGKMVSLADYKDAKGFIVIFTCNHCPFSIAYEDRIIDLHRKFAPKGYPVIAINPNDPEMQPDDSFEAMRTRAAEKGFPFAYLVDEGQRVYPQYGATRTPHVFILDKQRIVRYIGAIDDNHSDAAAVQKPYVEQAIGALEEGRAPAETFTRAVGCTIKARK
ncbi:MAG: thioredoxin family protein [Saprospiraceae bacterium]|nr:thioredoxin family protein [Saprospiraceae bacterium]